MSPSDDPVIQALDLTKVYPGGVQAVDRLNLAVRRTEIFGLLGRNGAGKTTTAGMFTTRVIPTAGLAFVNGVDVCRYPAGARRSIGAVSQTNTLDRSLTVRENLYFQGRYFGMSAARARSRASELLKRFELADRADARVPALSGGMAQRVMLARSIMHKPLVLFLDEPTAGLDPLSRISVWEMLVEMNEEGQTIFLTTHHMEEAEHLCTRLAILDRGKIIALDTPNGLKRSRGLATTLTLTVEGEPWSLAALLQREIDGERSVHVVEGRIRLSVNSIEGVLPLVVQSAERHRIRITGLSISEPTLEAVFIELLGKGIGE